MTLQDLAQAWGVDPETAQAALHQVACTPATFGEALGEAHRRAVSDICAAAGWLHAEEDGIVRHCHRDPDHPDQVWVVTVDETVVKDGGCLITDIRCEPLHRWLPGLQARADQLLADAARVRALTDRLARGSGVPNSGWRLKPSSDSPALPSERSVR